MQCVALHLTLLPKNSIFLQEIVQLELFAKQLYETTNASDRAELEKTMVQFASTPDCLNKCQLLLERGSV